MKLLDGGMGTTLRDNYDYNNKIIWSLGPYIEDNIDLYKKVYQEFLLAGSQILITPNYSATPYYLEKGKLNGIELSKVIKDLARICYDCKQNNSDILVAGALPPYGESYNPNVEIDSKILNNFYKLTIESLDDFCDFYLAETIASKEEAILIDKLLKNQNKKYYLSFCIKSDGTSLLDDTDLQELIPELSPSGIFFNCSPISNIDKAIDIFTKYIQVNNLDLQLGAYPNKHQHICENFVLESSCVTYSEITPIQFKEYVTKWKSQGLNFVGGCCGMGPDYISILKDLI